MSNALEEQEIQALCHKYGVPDLVLQWLGETEDFRTANEYILHEDICNLHPEDALLCICLCLRVIQSQYKGGQIISEKLKGLVTDVITNYGHNALHRQPQETRNEERLDIEFTARDLILLANDLEDLENKVYEENYSDVATIISALAIQAAAHAEIAKYVLSSFREEERKNREFDPDIVPFLKTMPVNDNTRAR